MGYARGDRAWGICQRCSQRALLNTLLFDEQYPNLRVHPECWDMKHPQERLLPERDPVSLWRPSPDSHTITAPVLTIEAQTGVSVSLAWTASSSAAFQVSGYSVYFRLSGSDDDWALHSTLLVVRDSYGLETSVPLSADFALPTSARYEFRVVATDTGRASASSNTVSMDIYPVSGWVNPGAELGNMTGWTASTGAMQAVIPAAIYAPFGAGTYYFEGSDTNALDESFQRVDMLAQLGSNFPSVAAGNVLFSLSWNGGTFIQSSPPYDQPGISFIFRDASLVEIGTAYSGYKDPTTQKLTRLWDSYLTSSLLPPNTRYVDVVMTAQRLNGTENDACFDEVGPPGVLIGSVSPSDDGYFQSDMVFLDCSRKGSGTDPNWNNVLILIDNSRNQP